MTDREKAIVMAHTAVCVLPTEKEFEHLEWLLKNHYKKELCEDAISRQAVLNAIAANCIRENEYNLTSSRIKNAVEQLPSVSTEKTDDYKQGWHDAIKKALKEAYTIHHYGDIFRVVQEETLIGVGMAYEQEPKTGHWINTGSGQKCSECGEIQYGYDSFRRFCAYCGARMQVVGNPDRLESKESDAENLCDSCKTKGCIFQSGIVRSHCDFYKTESEDKERND